jgi:hypothetical protein
MELDCSDIYERDKQMLIRALKAYGPFLVCSSIANIVCNNFTQIIPISTEACLLSMFGYFYHRLLHILPESAINTHIYVHHSHDKFISRELNLLLEVIPPIVNTVLFILLHKLLGISIVSYELLFLWTLFYISYHIVNYSIIGSSFHEKHHKYKNVNFSLDYWDHIFGTNATEEFEDLSHMIPNIICSFLVTYLLFKM